MQDEGMVGAPDAEVLDRAAVLGLVVFTQDDDFLVETTRRLRAGEPFSGVVYAHQLRVSVGKCIEDLELIALASELPEFVNRVEHLPL